MSGNIDRKYTKKVSMVYFWNAFLPLLIFCVVGFILFVIMKTPDLPDARGIAVALPAK
jgi:hypothetical protein